MSAQGRGRWTVSQKPKLILLSQVMLPASSASFCFLLIGEEKRSRLCLNGASQDFWTSLVLSCQTNFFQCEYPSVYKLIKTEPAVLTTQLQGMSSRLHLSNVKHVRNKDLTRRVFFEYVKSSNQRKDFFGRVCWLTTRTTLSIHTTYVQLISSSRQAVWVLYIRELAHFKTFS